MKLASVEHEVAQILLQMASGLSSNEFEKFLRDKVRKCELVKQKMTKKPTANGFEAKTHLVEVKTRKPSAEETITSTNNGESVAAKKRGRPKKLNGNIFPPAKRARKMVGMTAKEKNAKWNFESQHPKDNSAERHTLRMKWSKSAPVRQKRERGALEKLQMFFMTRPDNSYQRQFIKKFVPSVRMNASTKCDEKHLG